MKNTIPDLFLGRTINLNDLSLDESRACAVEQVEADSDV